MVNLFIDGNLLLNDKEIKELAYAFLYLSGSNIEEVIKKSIRNAIIYNVEFTKSNIYNEIFVFKHIFAKDSETDRDLLIKKAKYLRQCNNKIFSYSVIANILQISKTTASTLVAEEDKV